MTAEHYITEMDPVPAVGATGPLDSITLIRWRPSCFNTLPLDTISTVVGYNRIVPIKGGTTWTYDAMAGTVKLPAGVYHCSGTGQVTRRSGSVVSLFVNCGRTMAGGSLFQPSDSPAMMIGAEDAALPLVSFAGGLLNITADRLVSLQALYNDATPTTMVLTYVSLQIIRLGDYVGFTDEL